MLVVNGYVDDQNRALVSIKVSGNVSAEAVEILAWIDTAFDGHLVFSSKLINQLALEPLVETEAILADGSRVSLESYFCLIDWFGKKVPVQVIANEGRFPLIGTELLATKIVHIDYSAKTVSID